MPRLLLVDDNPSIHRIAESLLAPTDVELVCVDSAAEALDRLGRGERFDVALVDTAMPGMDGWTLLSRLRAMEETAAMPIALMAGVLDPVDPVKLAKAPIQGFLKKPIELRELGDRVKALLATPVVPPTPSPFSTVPAMSAHDLIQRAEASLPEFRPERVDPGVSFLEPIEAAPAPAEPMDDLLVLTADDLWPEEGTGAVLEPESLPEVQLELEELDLESLQELAVEPLATGPATEAIAGPSMGALDAVFPDETLVTLSGLEELDLGPEAPLEPAQAPAQTLAEPPSAPDALELEGPDLSVDVAPLAEPLPAPAPEVFELEMPGLPVDLAPLEGLPADLPPVEAAPAPSEVTGRVTASGSDVSSLVAEVMSVLGAPAAPLAAPLAAPALEVAAVDGQAPAVPGQFPLEAPAPSVPVAMEPKRGDTQAQAVVQAILADPVLVDALVKAVVARMGDQAIREIAWEVMPDLAGRLHS